MRLYWIGADAVEENDISYIRARFPLRAERAERYVKREDRLSAYAGGLLLDRVLGADESRIAIRADGKPLIENGPFFSLSHSGGRCVLAANDAPVGVDIELMDEGNLIAARGALTRAELEWISPEPLTRFHLLWTRKESLFKALGGADDPVKIEALSDRHGGWKLKSIIWEGFAVSVCAKEPGEITFENIKS